MYKNQRRKSDRLVPYNITSSASSIRKSNQFVSPVINRELTYSAKHKENRPSNLIDTTISDFNNVSMDLNKKEIVNQQVNNKIINNQNNKIELNQSLMNKELDEKLINKELNEKLINKELDQKLINKEINQLTNKTNDKLEEMIVDVKSNKQISNQRNLVKTNDDFDSDSEFDKIFEASSLSDKLNKQFPNYTTTTTDSTINQITNDDFTINQITNDDLNNRIQFNNEYVDDELFDSDAVITQISDTESTTNNEDESVDNNRINDDLFDNINDLNDEKINDDLNDEKINDYSNDAFDDDFNELDCTLIYNGNEDDDEPIIKSQAIPIDRLDCDFKTAAGNEIKIPIEKIKAMEQKARNLGLLPNFEIEFNNCSINNEV